MNPVVENYVVLGTEGELLRYIEVIGILGLTDGRNLLQHNFSLSV